MISKHISYIYYQFLHRHVLNARLTWTNVLGRRSIRLSGVDYNEYWEHDHSRGVESDIRVRTFLKIVEPGASVVEIGCGDGTLLSIMKRERQALVKGYDVSSVAVRKAISKGVDAEVWDATKGWPDNQKLSDYVIIADCLEHLPNPELLLQVLTGRFTKAVLVSIPNSCYWRYRLRVLFGSFMVQWVAHPGEHLRFWSISDMHWWLGQLGYKARSTYPTWGVTALKHIWPSMFAQNVIYEIVEVSSLG